MKRGCDCFDTPSCLFMNIRYGRTLKFRFKILLEFHTRLLKAMAVYGIIPLFPAYLVEALGKKLGPVIRIVEDEAGGSLPFSQSNVLSSNVVSFDSFRTIKKKYSMLVRFEIAD